MDKKDRFIILSVISVLLLILVVSRTTYAFVQTKIEKEKSTEIGITSCATIQLKDTYSKLINLTNTYPMSDTKGRNTTPYSFTISSSCDVNVGFNLYLVPLASNTLGASNIHYLVTAKGSKTALAEGVLGSATNGAGDFSSTDIQELDLSLNDTHGAIYKVYNASIPLKGSSDYDLYLWVDDGATNAAMNKTFQVGVAVKSYNR